ncbi:MAG: hypothetical protein NTX65_15425 [Ignavibacteriales bacterium]|nr:hypothetical protein [Ignavibacteriales bacterium]
MKFQLPATLLLIAAFTATCFISACDDTSNITNIDNVVIPSKNVSYSQHIQPIFTAKCTQSGCHDDQTHTSNLSLTSYSNTTASYLVVAAGFPQNSLLVLTTQGLTTNPMPPIGYPPLIKNQIDGIKIWVQEGAKNN